MKIVVGIIAILVLLVLLVIIYLKRHSSEIIMSLSVPTKLWSVVKVSDSNEYTVEEILKLWHFIIKEAGFRDLDNFDVRLYNRFLWTYCSYEMKLEEPEKDFYEVMEEKNMSERELIEWLIELKKWC